MKERPILFNGEMMRAILEGRKTQTRRILKPTAQDKWLFDGRWSDDYIKNPGNYVVEHCPYGKPGDLLWVKETFCSDGVNVWYRADNNPGFENANWQPSIHMPRWASRIKLEVVNVRVQRVQDISESDALQEGYLGLNPHYSMSAPSEASARAWYEWLWNSINEIGYGWDFNPFVWVVEFKRVTA